MRTISGERWTVAVVAGCAAAAPLYVGLRGLRLPVAVAAGVAAIFLVALVLWLVRRLPAELDGLLSRRRWLAILWTISALAAVVQTARLASFMDDPVRREQSLFPHDPWYVQHCCLTAYSEAARRADSGTANLYLDEAPPGTMVGPFSADKFHYPPPFLLLPAAVQRATGGDFLRVRSFWFGASALALLAAMGAVAASFEGTARLRAIGVAPALWISMPVQLGLQISNFQILVLAISMLAWTLLPRRAAAGGALLSFAIVSKIFPGVLGLYLLAARRWREALWTFGFGILIALLALAAFGFAPFRAFVDYELPRLSSGEAFARPFSRPFAVAHNMAPFGLALKLERLGVPGFGLAEGRWFSIVFGFAIVALAIRAGRRTPSSTVESASIWLALLSLGALASPFAPANYVLVSVLWLALFDRERLSPVFSAAAWVATSAPILMEREGPFVARAIAFFPAQALALGLPAWILWRAGRSPRSVL